MMCVCVCVGYGCVFFLWVCGILDHNSCSSQVTALFSRTYLAFLPRHDYHTPSTLATRNISIIPKWNWSNVPEMSNLHKQQRLPLAPYSSLSHTCFLFHIRVSSLYPPIQCRFLLSCRRNPLVESFPLSQPFVSLCAWGHFAVTSLQWPAAGKGKEVKGCRMETKAQP